MFTGIVKAVGEIGQMDRIGEDLRLTINAADLPWSEFAIGESISVNGVCLTAIELTDGGFSTDVSKETLAVSALNNLTVGSRVNLEPALAVGERLGGHFVSGHVDCIGAIREHKPDGNSVMLTIEFPNVFRRYFACKGSVAIDGVSLTINAVRPTSLTVNIIPHTRDATIAGNYQKGALVNIEVDMLARYLEQLLTIDNDNKITNEFLKEHGYV